MRKSPAQAGTGYVDAEENGNGEAFVRSQSRLPLESLIGKTQIPLLRQFITRPIAQPETSKG